MSRVFVSYAREDAALCAAVVSVLEDRGLDVWSDRRILAGRVWRESIAEAIEQMDCMVVIWSAKSTGKAWVIEEASIGAARGCLIPIVLGETLPPIGFRNLQAILVPSEAKSLPSETVCSLFDSIRAVVDDSIKQPIQNAHNRSEIDKSVADRRRQLPWLVVGMLLVAVLALVLSWSVRTKPIDSSQRIAPASRFIAPGPTRDAQEALNAGKYEEAYALAMGLIGADGADPTVVSNILYQSGMRLGRTAQASMVFARIIQDGLSKGRLNVRFLFERDANDFHRDPRISGAYILWLDAIAIEIAARQSCVDIVGHGSRVGSELRADQLSLARAERIRLELVSRAPQLAGKLRARGMGFRENLIATGTDDVADALDRRVEFIVTECRGG